MKLFDCTLRDGANVVGNGFSAALTTGIVEALLACGINSIEMGHAKGLGAGVKMNAPAPLTDEEYMKLAAPYLSKGEIGMFMLARCADADAVRMAADYGLGFIRVGMDASDGETAVEAVRMVKAAGLKCRYSLMKGYVSTVKDLADEAAMLADCGVDAITIMDSAGTMFPREAAEYVRALKNRVSIPVGFHGHSNLGLSQANALSAVEAGADEVDCGLLGMARSAGNCTTEIAAAVLQRQGMLKEIDLFGLLEYLDEKLIPAMREYDYRAAVTPADLVLGLAGCHSSFLGRFRQIADEEKVPLYRLICAVSAKDRKAPSEALMRAEARRLK